MKVQRDTARSKRQTNGKFEATVGREDRDCLGVVVKGATSGSTIIKPIRRRYDKVASLRQLSWVIGALGVILVGQSNELCAAYLDNGRLLSPIALGLCAIALLLGLRLLPRPTVGLPFGLLATTLIYTIVVGTLVSASRTSLEVLWSGAGPHVSALVTLTCVFVGLQVLLRFRSIGQIATIFTWIAAAIVAFQVISFALGHQPSIHETVEGGTFRYSGIFGNPNQASSFCVLLVCLSLLAPLSVKLRLALSCLAVAGLLVTFSRGGLVTFAAVCTANMLLGNAGVRVAFFLAFLTLVAFVLVGIPLVAQSEALPPAMAQHIIELHELVTGRGNLTDNSRGMLVAQALHAIESHPITGYGFGPGYQVLLGMGSHNEYTHFALEAGIPAAMLYTTAITALGWCGYLLKNQSERQFVVSIAAWLAAMGLSSHNLFDEKYSVLLIATACAIVAARLVPAGAREQIMKPRPLCPS
jgi:O-antigen ligase